MFYGSIEYSFIKLIRKYSFMTVGQAFDTVETLVPLAWLC